MAKFLFGLLVGVVPLLFLLQAGIAETAKTQSKMSDTTSEPTLSSSTMTVEKILAHDSIMSTEEKTFFSSTSDPISILEAKASLQLIEALSLNVYRRKTRANLKFLNNLIPTISELRQNISMLLDEESNPKNKMNLESFKEVDQFLEKNLDDFEMNVQEHHQKRKAFGGIVNQTEAKLRQFNVDFETVLKGHRSGRKHQPCGGFIKVTTDPTTFNYTRHQGLSGSNLRQETCIWVIASGKPGISGVQTKVMKFNLGDAGSENVLSIHKRDSDDSGLVDQIVRSYDEGSTSFEHENHLIVVFSTVNSNGSPHFELQIESLSPGSYANVTVRHIDSNATSGVLDYPGNGQSYSNDERTYFILNPLPNHQVDTSVERINTEGEYDRVTLESYRRGGTFKQLARYSGSDAPVGSENGQLNMPVVVSFRSDRSNTYTGFKIRYRLNDI